MSLSALEISPGDELSISLDGIDGSGVARLEVVVNNTPNTALASHDFGSSWGTFSTTITVPGGATTLDLWLYSNYNRSSGGTTYYDNLEVFNLSAGPPCDPTEIETYYADVDGDGFGDASDSVDACEAPDGYVLDNTDCDDNEPLSYPGNVEVCDGIDNDCDGEVDEDFVIETYYADVDGDGFGDASDSIEACEAPDGYVLDGTDCDDSEPLSYPGNVEVCDGIDNDCDGDVDEGFELETYYADVDGDGFGDPNDSVEACEAPDGYVLDGTDCDDSEPLSYPGNIEVCDGIDNDCDGDIDEGLECIIECPDNLPNENIFMPLPAGELVAGMDSALGTLDEVNGSPCGIALSNPSFGEPWSRYRIPMSLSALEISPGDELSISLDGIDGSGVARLEVVVNNTPNTALASHDFGSSWGTFSTTITVPGGATTLDLWLYSNYNRSSGGTTYYDNLEVINLSAGPPCDPTEIETYYADVDGDGFGDASDSVDACEAPDGYVLDNTDCDDNEPLSYPGNIEVCDGIDNDCDGDIDEGFTLITYYADVDGDGFGDASDSVEACEAPDGYVLDGTDCDDSEPLSYPGNVEVCDGIDNDCDGDVDEGLECIIDCPDNLPNENALLPLPVGELVSGMDAVIGTSDEVNGSPCGISLVNPGSGEPWSRYRIPMSLSTLGISPGDELSISLDGIDGSGVARLEVTVNNTPNTSLASHNFTSTWSTFSTTITVPGGATTLDLWLYSNYNRSTGGTTYYDNLEVINLSAASPLRAPLPQALNVEMVVSPNPGDSLIQLEFSSNIESGTVLLFDINGRLQDVLVEGELESPVEFYVDEYPNGTYILVLESEDQRISERLLINR